MNKQGELFGISALVVPVQSTDRVARSGTFVDNLKLPIHRWFKYSAGFSAEWAEKVIRTQQPKTVLDPFAGSGTTLLAAEAAGALSFGYESHPFMARVASAKLLWHIDTKELIKASKEFLGAVKKKTTYDLDNTPPLLLKCYTVEALQQLFLFRETYLKLKDTLKPEVAQLIWLAITAILRPCSFAGTAQWQYILPNKRKANTRMPVPAFEAKILDFVSDMLAFQKLDCRHDAKILLQDARTIPDSIPKGSIELVLTSPPYPNNYDYADATRLEMTFWGEIQSWGDLQGTVRQYIIRSSSQHATAEKLKLEDLLKNSAISSIHEELSLVCNELALVRQTKGGKKAYHTMIAAYFNDLAATFQALRSVCKRGANLCFVIGDSAPYGVYVPVEEWLGKLAISSGFTSYTFEKLRDRNIKWKNRKHRVPLHEGRLWIRG